VSDHPRGYVAAWSALGLGAAALIAFNLVHHGESSPPQAGPRPRATVTVTRTATPPSTPDTHHHQSQPLSAAQAHEDAAHHAMAHPAASPSPRIPTPSPGPGKVPVPGIGSPVVVPLRGAGPTVSATVVAPSAPPDPPSTPALQVSIGPAGISVKAVLP
jgi:hypothetical protein